MFFGLIWICSHFWFSKICFPCCFPDFFRSIPIPFSFCHLFGEGRERAVVTHPVLITSHALCGTDTALAVSAGRGGGGHLPTLQLCLPASLSLTFKAIIRAPSHQGFRIRPMPGTFLASAVLDGHMLASAGRSCVKGNCLKLCLSPVFPQNTRAASFLAC